MEEGPPLIQAWPHTTLAPPVPASPVIRELPLTDLSPRPPFPTGASKAPRAAVHGPPLPRGPWAGCTALAALTETENRFLESPFSGPAARPA